MLRSRHQRRCCAKALVTRFDLLSLRDYIWSRPKGGCSHRVTRTWPELGSYCLEHPLVGNHLSKARARRHTGCHIRLRRPTGTRTGIGLAVPRLRAVNPRGSPGFDFGFHFHGTTPHFFNDSILADWAINNLHGSTSQGYLTTPWLSHDLVTEYFRYRVTGSCRQGLDSGSFELPNLLGGAIILNY